jgi:hypothetical protein
MPRVAHRRARGLGNEGGRIRRDFMHDFLRFWWELVALNTRKTVFRLRGSRGPAPCQAESDSGKALETHCEACALWNKPGRFTRVCPLLKWAPDGWRCSADAADVRPFWGIALAYYAAAAACLYVAATLLAFGLLREVGYELRYVDVAWPPAWQRFEAIRSRFYFKNARAALAENRISEASLSLALAYEFGPTNYEAGFALAQLWQAGQTTLSDRIYGQLLASHPAQAAATAKAWGQALLWRGDFSQLAKLAAARLREEPPPATAWLHALIFSARQERDGQALVALATVPQLTAESHSLLRLEAAAIDGGAAATAQLLSAKLTDEASAYARYYQIRFLIDAGDARRALELLDAYGAKLPPDERVGLSLGALDKLGEKAELRRQTEALLIANPRPQIYEVVAAHLIRHPNPDLLRLVNERLANERWRDSAEGTPAHAAMLCATGVGGETALLAQLRTRMRRVTHAPLRALDRAEAFFAPRNNLAGLGSFLAALPMLPVETVYALFEAEAARARRQP